MPTSKSSILYLENVNVSFDGFRALNNLSLTVKPGEMRAIIGPNGAGKTTLFNVVTGILPPSAGSIRFMGKDITKASVHEISRLGLARTLQIKSVFHGMTVRENLWIAAQSREGVFKPFKSAKSCRAANDRADGLLVELELTHLANQEAANLSYGDVALLEIGIALATEPKLPRS